MPLTRRLFLRSLWTLPLLTLPESAPAALSAAHQTCLLNRFAVAGLQYHEAPALLHHLAPGQPLTLAAEPDNPFDHFAVRIDLHGRKLGYVPRSDNRHISRLLRQDVRLWCRVRKMDEDKWPWRAVVVEVGLGEVPPPAEHFRLVETA
ncbi:MAG: HIRAN protein [Desulfovibrionales bacterium]|nr:MAG: HIRAN protein [Desulfovibrionales bacterium]